ncbi:hypothetical protein glysoja_034862 [Glycine soja]|uniref:Uncharacterized protein n=1 Tax=Glycine soja TaxID=3848 RepID=A0A0B2RFZ8_GLYSO|nr:hypothetical protein glysoja_034862 [Glycine soja]
MIVCPSLVHPLITVSLPKKKDGPIALNEENRFDLVNALKVAFKTGDFKWQVVFIGGLADDFLATSFGLSRVAQNSTG